MELTPGELAAADQITAKLKQVHDAVSTYASCIYYAGQGGDEAVVAAHKHIWALVSPLRSEEILGLVVGLALNLIAQVENYPLTRDIGGHYWSLLCDEERDYITNFVASGGTQCCALGPGNHAWDRPDVEE